MYSGSSKLLVTAAVFGAAMAFWAVPASAQGTGVQYTLEGCRIANLPAGYDLEGNNFLCDAEPGVDAYTTGNLGAPPKDPNWNELDLVPHRVTTATGQNAPDSQTFDIVIAADHMESGIPGYDVITVPVINPLLSAPSCGLVVDPDLPPDPQGFVLDPGVGGTDQSLVRMLRISQLKNTTCVFDYQERLALGSSQFPGASLHSNILNTEFGTQNVGNKDVSIPVRQIAPQELSKQMTAFQDVDFVWNISKTANPGEINFQDTCELDPPEPQQVTLTVTWTKSPGTAGMIDVTTTVSAFNPSARTIIVTATDQIFSGVTPEGPAVMGLPTEVGPGATEVVLTHELAVPQGTEDLNDVATATYIDDFTGVPVPGTTEATASAEVQVGDTTNQTADITDTESLNNPEGLTFSVESFVGPGDIVTPNNYMMGDKT